MDWFFDQALNWLTARILDSLKFLWDLLAETAFTTPDVTTLRQVTRISGTSLTIVNTCFVLVIITAGILVMTRETLQIRYGIAELGPRMVVAFIAANMSPLICSTLIDSANALTQALTGEGIDSPGAFGQLRDTVTAALTNPAAAILATILGLLIAGLTVALIITWIVRLGVLVVLVGIAPIALACHALPQTEAAAKLWWRALLGTVGTVVLQALALHTALSVFLDPAANEPALGLPSDPNGIFNLFIVVCLLWAVVKIPGMMRRYVTKGGGGNNIGGYLLRVVIVQQLTKGVGRALRHRPAPRPAPGGAAAGGGHGPAPVRGTPGARPHPPGAAPHPTPGAWPTRPARTGPSRTRPSTRRQPPPAPP